MNIHHPKITGFVTVAALGEKDFFNYRNQQIFVNQRCKTSFSLFMLIFFVDLRAIEFNNLDFDLRKRFATISKTIFHAILAELSKATTNIVKNRPNVLFGKNMQIKKLPLSEYIDLGDRILRIFGNLNFQKLESVFEIKNQIHFCHNSFENFDFKFSENDLTIICTSNVEKISVSNFVIPNWPKALNLMPNLTDISLGNFSFTVGWHKIFANTKLKILRISVTKFGSIVNSQDFWELIFGQSKSFVLHIGAGNLVINNSETLKENFEITNLSNDAQLLIFSKNVNMMYNPKLINVSAKEKLIFRSIIVF